MALLAVSVIASSAFVGRASASGQSATGFAEASAGDQFQVMGPDWTVRTDLRFSGTETVRVNVTSINVDWNGKAGGGGARELTLRRYDGTTLATASFAQSALGPLNLYSASIALGSLALAPDMYYLWIFIDDTASTFEATTSILVGANPVPRSIETFTDETFAHPSDVFTTTSTVWVRVRGNADSAGDRWDLYEFLDANSPVGGPRGGFADFQRVGDVYTFSIDLAPWSGNLVSGWSYTLSVRLANGAFDAGKQIQIFDPTLTIRWTDIAPAQARQGQTDVPMLALDLSLNADWNTFFGPAAFNLERLRITRTGTGTNADIAAVHIWEDGNGNGALDGSDVRIATRSALGGVPFPAWVGQNGVGMATIESSGPRHLLVTYDIAPTATVGNDDGALLEAAADVDLAGHFAAIEGLPAQSTNVQIVAASVLTVTNDPGVAPGTVSIGQTEVAMDLLTMTSNAGVITVDEISVSLAGTGRPGDISQASLHVDDGDGAYSPSIDPRLGNPATFPAVGPVVFRNLNFAVDTVGRDVWIVLDIASGATIGDTVGTSLPDNASVRVTAGSVFGGTFPLDSGLAVIEGPSLTVAGTDIAPAQARLGRANVPMLRLDLSTAGGQVTVTGLRVDKRGTSTSDADVPLAKVWLDDGDMLFDLGDTLLGQQSFVGGTTVIGLAPAVVVTAGTTRIVFITYDISASATLGVTVVARLANEMYVAVDAASSVSAANFPIVSSPVTIVAGGPGAFLTVGSIDLALNSLQVARGQTNVPMEKLVLTADANQATLTGIRVDRRGTATDADIAAVKLYRDANGDGNFGAVDSLLASSTFVAGVTTLGGLSVVISAAEPVTLFIAIDIAPGATVNATVGIRLADESYLSVDVNSTVDPNSFAIASSEVTVTAQQATAPPGDSTLLVIAVGAGVAFLALLGLMFAMLRRRRRCPVCGKRKAPDRRVCPECEAKGLGAGTPVPPPPPPPS